MDKKDQDFVSYPVYLHYTDYNSISTQCTLLTGKGSECHSRRLRQINLADLSYKDQLHWHFKQFCYKTSSHGIPMLGRAPNNFYRIIWLILLCGCCAMFLYQSSNVVKRYSRYDKITDIQLNFDTAPFPAITICSLNPYLDSLLKDVEAIKKILNVYTTIILRAARTNEVVSKGGEPDLSKALKRVKRQSNTTFFEPAYSKCECVRSISNENRLECTADKTSIPTLEEQEEEKENVKGLYVGKKTKCLCAFDRESGDAWPCYPYNKWDEQICGFCDKQSFCTLQARQDHPFANRSCLCQSFDPFCVGLSKEVEIVKLWQYYGFFEKEIIETLGFQNMSDEVAIVTKAKENLIFAMSELSEKQRIALSIPKDQLIQKCSFNGKACDIEKDFKIMADPTFGNCFTFNFDRNKIKSSIRAGAMHGLRVLVYVNAVEYLPITESVGVRITIHDQDQFPFPDTFGYNAPTGFISSFRMKLSKMSRLPAPYGDCEVNETNEKYIYKGYRYSTEGCYRNCFQEMVVKECGCADPRFPAPPNEIHCEVFNSNARKCLEDQTIRLGHMHDPSTGEAALHCRCRQPCQQSVYTVSYSAANWPSQLLNMSKIGQCPLEEDDCKEYFQENGAMIEVFYEALNFEVFVESEAYGLVKMMADFGGQLGLWSGVSFMTCVEFLFFFSELIFMVFKHHYHKQQLLKLENKH